MKMNPLPPMEIPTRQPNTKVEKIEVPGGSFPVRDGVGWFTLILQWIKTNLGNDILNFIRGENKMESKLWYASKTLWMNLITLVWTFLGPLVGIPVLDTDTMIGILAVINIILRVVTKSPVTLK